MKKKHFLFALLLVLPLTVGAVSTIPGQQGGTGISTTTVGNLGSCLKVASTTPFLTYTLSTCGSGGGSSSATTTINGADGPTFTFSSSSDIAVSSTGATFQWVYLNPQSFISTTTGNWIGTWQGTNSSTYFKVANNLSEGVSSTIRSNLGLTDTALLASSTWYKVANINPTSTIATGATTATGNSFVFATSSSIISITCATATCTWNTTASSTWGLVPTARLVNTTSPITGGAALSGDLTIACATCQLQASSTVNGLIGPLTIATSSAYANNFTYTNSGNTITFNVPKRITDINNLATTTGNFLVANGTWTSVASSSLGFAPASRNINTTSPITGGGALTGDLTIACATCGTGTVATTTPVTVNYFPYWGSGTGLTGTSSVYQSSGNIGIATTTPLKTFVVASSTSGDELFSVNPMAATSTLQLGDVGTAACLKLRDKNNGGWSYCTITTGTLTCNTTACDQ